MTYPSPLMPLKLAAVLCRTIFSQHVDAYLAVLETYSMSCNDQLWGPEEIGPLYFSTTRFPIEKENIWPISQIKTHFGHHPAANSKCSPSTTLRWNSLSLSDCGRSCDPERFHRTYLHESAKGFFFYPHAFLKKRWGYCNRLRPSVRPSVCPSVCPSVRPSVTLSPPKLLDEIQPNLVCELLT